MSDGPNTFEAFIGRIRRGDASAAEEFVQKFEPIVRRAAHFKLNDGAVRRQMDSLDVCQSVMAGFFTRVALGELELREPGDLVKLLGTMARNRVFHHLKKQRAKRRDVRRNQSNDDQAMPLAGSDPTPSMIVADRELLERARGILSPEERRIADERAEGKSWEEIAAGLHQKPDAVRVRLSRALDRVCAQLGFE
jgi:RNA polymerase sigma factor (sigma-70 family)